MPGEAVEKDSFIVLKLYFINIMNRNHKAKKYETRSLFVDLFEFLVDSCHQTIRLSFESLIISILFVEIKLSIKHIDMYIIKLWITQKISIYYH